VVRDLKLSGRANVSPADEECQWKHGVVAYNSRMNASSRGACAIAFALTAIFAQAQTKTESSRPGIMIANRELPKAQLWIPYLFRLGASGGIEPYHWALIAGALPRDVKLRDRGDLAGIPDESGQFEFTLLVTDNTRTIQQKQKMTLNVEVPLTAEWGRRATVNGQRIDGSVKVSNRTGRDFDLTVIVLAVNEISRATAIGYQHFPLKRDTRDLDIPFGDTLSPGTYAVNVDVVGEEPVSNRIFRARLVSGQESITQGP
jgi:hypothetical protein